MVSQQIGQANVNGTESKALTRPLPPASEQDRIVEEIERITSLIDATDDAVAEQLRAATGLRQSILKRAFEGRLVRQDPSDEPASALLERIRAERGGQTELALAGNRG